MVFAHIKYIPNSNMWPVHYGRYVGWGGILNCFMLSSLPCFYAFADLLSLHLVTFFMFFILVYIEKECFNSLIVGGRNASPTLHCVPPLPTAKILKRTD